MQHVARLSDQDAVKICVVIPAKSVKFHAT